MRKLLISESEKYEILQKHISRGYNTIIYEQETQNKIETEPVKPTNFCPVISESSTGIVDFNKLIDKYKKLNPQDPYSKLNSDLNEQAKTYNSQGIRERPSCQIALTMIREDSNQKNIFIVDTREQLIYLFDKSKKFIARDVIISGKNEQSEDPKIVAKSLLDWNQRAEKLGYTFNPSKGDYFNKKGIALDPSLVYNDIYNDKSAFLPKGRYVGSSDTEDVPSYYGNKDNLLPLVKDDKGNVFIQAIHGYKIDAKRQGVMNKAKEVLSKPEDPNVSKEFLDLVFGGTLNFKQSSSCINVSEDFVKYISTYGPNSYVFSIGETEDNYLVKNGSNYFDKTINSESCPSPNSLGAESINYGIA